MAKSEKLNFQTEVKQLLDLMIHSLYSNKEIAISEIATSSNEKHCASKCRKIK